MSNTNFVALAGLPRSGSTLFTSILNQNKKVYASSNSPLCEIMWHSFYLCNNSEQALASGTSHKTGALLTYIINGFYHEIDKEIIIDKARSWTTKENFQILNIVFEQPKSIVLVRDVKDVVKSFIKLRIKNNIKIDVEKDLIDLENIYHPLIMKPFLAVKDALKYETNSLFIDYDNLIKNPNHELNRFYKYLDLDSFFHDFNNIKNVTQENDSVYGLKNMHKIRGKVEKIQNNVKISKELEKKCDFMNRVLDDLGIKEKINEKP